MIKRQKIYEGKAKILFKGPDPDTLIQYFKDDATAFNAEKKAVIEGKGALNNILSEHFMKGLSSIGIPTHFLQRLNMREQLIKSCEIIPLEIVVRNFAAGSMSQRLGVKEGTKLSRPLVEFYFKNDELNDPLVTEEHIVGFNWATQAELEEIMTIALRVNDFISGMMHSVNIKLVDFKIEIGRFFDNEFEKLIIADEISPDSCRLWDSLSGEKLDKDIFRQDLGNLIDGYREVAKRFGVLPNQSFSELKEVTK
ncbi:MAG: phosphoribosylaminoimidazolesuccinocarboxamide synthase [Rhodobacteraceae bacterium]|nr:MAG: phosphoribosylaminoimidazolesuccinocarboxamide synthase [Paracoccaceae bacterium]|tara:strand:+ start:1463 stop:2221 length:759 start_codon:yes stop_codon:yes gene_type:complete